MTPTLQSVVLNVTTGQNLCSFKNHKRVTKRGGLITDPKIKRRMQSLEDSIVSSLYSASATTIGATGLDSASQSRTALCELLSGLTDDSLKQIPEFSFGVEYVPEGSEGVQITITRL